MSDELLLFDEDELLSFRASLLNWFDHAKRDLPWRRTQDPYAIWISEIMLQQTRVATVRDYYERWLTRFPDVLTLAQAPLDDVLELWAGLGYYRRARMIHQAALHITTELAGQMPEDSKSLLSLPGVGRYTAGAIASIAYQERAPIVDGNVERILSRLRAISGDPKSRANQKHFWALAEQVVDPDRPGDLNQSMMELGAVLCTPKNPTCLLCPVRSLCQAFVLGDVLAFPQKVKRKPNPTERILCVVAYTQDPESHDVSFLCRRRPVEGLFGGLWEFPTTQWPEEDSLDTVWEELSSTIFARPQNTPAHSAGQVEHKLTHKTLQFDVRLMPVSSPLELIEANEDDPIAWVSVEDVASLGMATAMRKVEACALAAMNTENEDGL